MSEYHNIFINCKYSYIIVLSIKGMICMGVNNEYIGKRIRILRNELQLSQEELGKIIAVDKTTISGYETGRIAPPLDVVVRLAKYFHVSADYLLGITDNRFSISRLGDRASNGLSIGKFIELYLSLSAELRENIAVLVTNLKK